jgi:hypothetical protein
VRAIHDEPDFGTCWRFRVGPGSEGGFFHEARTKKICGIPNYLISVQ